MSLLTPQIPKDWFLPAPPCVSCESVTGLNDGCCVVCGCPSFERQLRTAPQRVNAFAIGDYYDEPIDLKGVL